MMRNFFLLAAAAAFSASAAAIPPTVPPPAPPPRLLIVISVDMLAADLFDEYRPQFTGGFAQLARGTVFRNGYQSHAATETCPGHATMLTGNRPARTGIVANQWFDQSAARGDKAIYCAEDERVPGSTSKNYKLSAEHLRGPTLGDLIKRESPASRNVAIGGKDRSAMMMAGRSADQLWYWSGNRFGSGLEGAAVPAVVAPTNAAVAAAIAGAREPLEAPPFCAARAQPVAVAGHGPVGAGNFARAAGDASAFRATPEFDGAVLALAAGLIQEMKLGQGSAPDILSIGLSATDYIGHYSGLGGQEMCLQLLSLDRDLGDFFALLDRAGIDYAVALTADHGAQDIPERLRLKGVASAQRVDPELGASEVGKSIASKFGLTGPVLIGDVSGDIYVDRNLASADRSRALAEAMRTYRAHPQVAAVFTSDEVMRTAMPRTAPDRWSLIERVRASFDPRRSGDFYVVLNEHVTPIGHVTSSVATHGTPWDHDRRVPIIFWRPGMAPASREEAVETVDIMPTLSAMLRPSGPRPDVDGKCLERIQGVACPQR